MKDAPNLVDEKIRLEIQLLREQIDEKKNQTIEMLSTRINNWIKKWSISILTLVSVVGGIWGVIIPIKNYFEEQERKLKYSLNSQMVSLVNDLSENEEREQAIMMLQYYEMNAYDILIFKLESAGSDLTLVQAISSAINSIYQKGHEDEVLDNLLSRLQNRLDRTVNQVDVNDATLSILLNYVTVLKELETLKDDRKRIVDFSLGLKNQVPKIKSFWLLRDMLDELCSDIIILDIQDSRNSRELMRTADYVDEIYQLGFTTICSTILAQLNGAFDKCINNEALNETEFYLAMNYLDVLDEIETNESDSLKIMDLIAKCRNQLPDTTAMEPLKNKLAQFN